MLNDATVISYTCIFLPVTGVALFALGWLFVFRNACQGMGKTVLPMVSGIVEVAMRVMVVLLLDRALRSAEWHSQKFPHGSELELCL